jgi:uncharacterized membrane protein
MDTQTTFHLLSPLTWTQAAVLAFVAVALLVLARAIWGSPLSPARRPVLWVLRGLILALLVAILANPVRVDRLPGRVERSNVVYLLDTSASMALGESASRFAQAVQMVREVDRLVPAEKQPTLSVYRFGQRLAAIDSPALEHLASIGPTDADTQLLSALRQLTGRFVGAQPHSVVLFSDGRCREPDAVQDMARRYAELRVPIHAVPLGQSDRGGDVAVVNMVAPARVRKHSQVGATVWVRSYGYDGLRTELRLEAVSRADEPARPLSRLPITLTGGIQAFNLNFQSDLETTRVRAAVPLQADEVSPKNNAVAADIAVDRTKIRVLYVEGSTQGFSQRYRPDGTTEVVGPHSALHTALSVDPDIECVPVLALGQPDRRGSPDPAGTPDRQVSSTFYGIAGGIGSTRAFPETRAQLFAYDAIILSDVGRNLFDDEQLALIDEWIRERGGGLCMAGGPRSFADGGWSDSVVAGMLPLAFPAAGRSWTLGGQLTMRPDTEAVRHPIWNIVSDARRNETILTSAPAFTTFHLGLSAKQTAQVLATGKLGGGGGDPPVPVLAVGPYGKGRTLAAAVSLNSQWSPEFASRWGESDNRYYAKLWRNAVYWLTENSYLGRRRLVVASDKTSYQPGDTIKLAARAFDETSHPATNCRVTVTVQPHSFDADLSSDYAPVRWPNAVERSSGETSPYVAWGEELNMLVQKSEPSYALELPLAEQLTGGAAAEALRLELSAYEDLTLIDSTSTDVQILDDPFEHRNPLPDLAQLGRVAERSGGRVFSDAVSLAAMLRELPVQVGPEEIRKVPLWSRWWLLGLLIGLLTTEWVWRRRLGLA